MSGSILMVLLAVSTSGCGRHGRYGCQMSDVRFFSDFQLVTALFQLVTALFLRHELKKCSH